MDKQQQRWQSETKFFDAWAEKASARIAPLDPLTLARYGARRPRRRFNKEFRFRILGALRGRRVLDVGCGEGVNAVLLAKLGASVTGIDISPKAIDLARRRAQANGVADRATFLCSPLEKANLPPASFDVVWADAILHHLISELDFILRLLVACTKPGGILLFSEPVNFNAALRRLRFMVPVHTEATPDERPLERAEIEIVRRHIPDLRLELFTMLGRLDQFVLPGYNYERASPVRRGISNVMAMADYVALRLPGLSSFAGTAVMWGPRPPADHDPRAGNQEPAERS
jgi:2-polyprenyl-3-methyl-5-hydroxy-6-metoxy-1,4-benzoquinol methylase